MASTSESQPFTAVAPSSATEITVTGGKHEGTIETVRPDTRPVTLVTPHMKELGTIVLNSRPAGTILFLTPHTTAALGQLDPLIEELGKLYQYWTVNEFVVMLSPSGPMATTSGAGVVLSTGNPQLPVPSDPSDVVALFERNAETTAFTGRTSATHKFTGGDPAWPTQWKYTQASALWGHSFGFTLIAIRSPANAGDAAQMTARISFSITWRALMAAPEHPMVTRALKQYTFSTTAIAHDADGILSILVSGTASESDMVGQVAVQPPTYVTLVLTAAAVGTDPPLKESFSATITVGSAAITGNTFTFAFPTYRAPGALVPNPEKVQYIVAGAVVDTLTVWAQVFGAGIAPQIAYPISSAAQPLSLALRQLAGSKFSGEQRKVLTSKLIR